MATESPHRAEDYTVGWICALPVELAASAELLDVEHPQLPHDTKDSNSYTFGSIAGHNIVIGCLPFGQIGLVSAASVAIQMKSRFPSIRFGLMVGIGGGVPTENSDIRLGDVVVSLPSGQYGGVVQYDMGKTLSEGQNIRTGALNAPPQILLTALAAVEAARLRDRFDLKDSLSSLGARLPKFAYPQKLRDRLYKSTYAHSKGATCAQCSEDQLEERPERDDVDIVIHYGTIASGNQVMKDGVERDRLSSELGGVLCFEMEAAGLINNFPCVVIRGICDYADSHKNKLWQPYAAATAAAFAKALLGLIPATEVVKQPTVEETMKDLSQLTSMVADNTELSHKIEEKISTAEEDKILQWLSGASFSKPQNMAREARTPGTGQWLLDLEAYTHWRDSTPGLLWIHGAAGSGKTVLCSTAIENIHKKYQQQLAYWYFQFSNDSTQKIGNLLRSLIRQLSTTPLADSISLLWQNHNRTGSEPGIGELTNVLDEVISIHKQQVFIVMDALDECPQTPDQSERAKLLTLVLNLLGKHSNNLHILITSRPEHDIYSSMSSYPSINLEAFVASDVKHFVTSSLQSGDLKVWDVEIRQEIEDRLLSIETKRFRWADLQIRRLQSCYTKDQIQEALRTIPKSLEAAYEEALNNIPRKDADIARLILIWLAFSFVPMSIHEIAAAVRLPHPEFVLRICTSILVTLIHENTDTVIKLAHFSVKEYLVSETEKGHIHGDSFNYQFSSNLAHATICDAAISYLLDTNSINVSEQTVIDMPLLSYSADYWPHHVAAISEDITGFPHLSQQISRFFSPEYFGSYLNWHRMSDLDDDDHSDCGSLLYGQKYNLHQSEHGGPDDSSPGTPYRCLPRMYYAAMLGFGHIVQKLLGDDDEISAKYETLEWSCILAAGEGHSKVVEILLSDKRCHLKKNHLEQIFAAVNTNIKVVVRVLLDSGALRTPAEDSKEDVLISEWSLETAVGSWENGLEITKALFEHLGAHAHSLITERVIQEAARNGMSGVDVLQFLLDQRPGPVNGTAKTLQAAAGNRIHGIEVMTILLDRMGSGLHISKEVVMEAAKNTKSGKKVILLLLERPDTIIEDPEEIFEVIVENFDEDVTRIFLDRNVDVEVTEKVLKSGARNSKHRDQILRLLVKMYLDRVGPEGEIPEEVQRELGIWAYGGMKKLDLDELEASSSTSKGRLEVQVNGSRGLQKSEEVFVVAVFQQNEFISKTFPTARHESSDEVLIHVPSLHESTGQAINVKQRRQGSVISISEHQDFDAEEYQTSAQMTWDIRAVFDVVGSNPQLSVTVYGRENGKESFLGHANIDARLTEKDSPLTGWFQLSGRTDHETGPWGEINIELTFQQGGQKHWKPEDFDTLKLIGKGFYGQVYQVRKNDTKRVYAMKVISKKIIVKKKEIARFVGERNILVRATATNSPFVTGLKFAFQTPTDLYLATDYMDGGELFWHLQKEGRFDEAQTKFYVAELILALQHLHSHGIIYRDLRPESILLDANGHIALSDFSLSKMVVFGATTNSFCGNTEYLAPEVLLDETGYTRMVDFWSLGVLMYEMSCGWSPFYAEDTHQMYKNIAFGKLRFPRDYPAAEGRALIKGLLQRNPKKRLGATYGAEELKRHAFFSKVDWDALAKKLTPPPIIPKLHAAPRLDPADLDPYLANAFKPSSLLSSGAAALSSGLPNQTPLSPSMQAAFQGFTFVDETALETPLAYDSWPDDMDEWLKDEIEDNRVVGNAHDNDDFFETEDSFKVW